LKKPYVAIVDDDSAFANYLRTFLSLRGYDTKSYSRGDELLAAVKQGDPPDIVLLDVMMPGMNGLETLRALKAAKPDLQAIMLSGREQASTIVEAVRLGAADYVVKPDDPRVLFAGSGEATTGETGAVLRSNDGGQTWQNLPLPVRPNATIWGLATHPAEASRIVAWSLFGEVYVSEDVGESWRKIAREFGEIRTGAWLPG